METIGFINRGEQTLPNSMINAACSFNHYFCIGETGSGKTASFILPMIKRRLREGHSIVVFDQKNKLHLSAKALCEEEGINLENVHQLGILGGVKINLVHGMGEKGLDHLSKMIIPEEHDLFWTNAARQMFLRCALYVRALKHALVLMERSSGFTRFNRDGYFSSSKAGGKVHFTWNNDNTQSVRYPIELTTEPFVFNDIAFLFQNVKHFLSLVESHGVILEWLEEEAFHLGMEPQVLTALERVRFYAKAIEGYSIKADLSDASGHTGVYFMISSLIKELCVDYLNDPHGINVTQWLNEGNHLIINSEAMSTKVASTILNSLQNQLASRAKFSGDIKPVSIIIDEAYRVLSNESDVQNDILREAKTEIIMAAQNTEQMIECFGENRWRCFELNFANRITYRGGDEELDTFEYIDRKTGMTHQAMPVFHEYDALMRLEAKYQRAHHLYEEYLNSDDEVAIFDHNLYDAHEEVIIYDLCSRSYRHRHIHKNLTPTLEERLVERYEKHREQIAQRYDPFR